MMRLGCRLGTYTWWATLGITIAFLMQLMAFAPGIDAQSDQQYPYIYTGLRPANAPQPVTCDPYNDPPGQPEWRDNSVYVWPYMRSWEVCWHDDEAYTDPYGAVDYNVGPGNTADSEVQLWYSGPR